jgi:hypothetical protein
MSDPALQTWNLQGHLHLWRHTKRCNGMEGWHLNADEAACRSMADLIDRMLVASWKPQKLIPVTVPRVMKNCPGVPWASAPALRLCYTGEEVDESYWYMQLQEKATVRTALA